VGSSADRLEVVNGVGSRQAADVADPPVGAEHLQPHLRPEPAVATLAGGRLPHGNEDTPDPALHSLP
jgi:hypothetical protein